MNVHLRLTSSLVAVTLAALSDAIGQPEAKPFVSGTTEGPTESRLANYDKHESHPIRRWTVALNNGRFRASFQSWVDVDASHAPAVIPLEGMIGFPEPAGGNWYSNGFMNLLIGNQLVGTIPPKSVGVLETGERGRARFVWQRPEGTWSVVFVVLPKDDKVFCTVRLFPKNPATPLKVQLTCYPGGQTTDGNRAVTTANRTVEQTNNVEADAANEWWYAIYDTVYDYGVRGDGGAGVLLAPECLGQSRLEVTGYPVILHLTAPPGKREIRMILWDSFFGKRNAQIVEYLKGNADALLKELQVISFEDRRLYSTQNETEAKAIAEYLARLRQPQPEQAKAEELTKAIASLRDRLRASPGGISPDEEDELLGLFDAQRKLLWDLRWKELLNTPQ